MLRSFCRSGRHRRGRDRECGRRDFDGCRAAAAEQRFHASEYATDVGAATQPSLPRVRVLLQALSECASCAEDQCLDGALGQAKLGRDLVVGEPLPLALLNRAALGFRHPLDDVLEADELVRCVVRTCDDLLQDLEVVR